MVDTAQVATELTMAMTRLRARLRLESSAPMRSWLTTTLDAVVTPDEPRPLADAVKVLRKLADAP